MNKIYHCLSCLFIATLIISSCEAAENVGTDPVSGDPVKLEVSTEKLYEDFKNPWGMTWLPDGRLLVTEKAGEILVFKEDKFTGEKLSGLPIVSSAGQGGLLDIQLHPDYQSNGWIYISYSKPVEGGITTAVSRFKLQGNQVTDLQDIFSGKTFYSGYFSFWQPHNFR